MLSQGLALCSARYKMSQFRPSLPLPFTPVYTRLYNERSRNENARRRSTYAPPYSVTSKLLILWSPFSGFWTVRDLRHPRCLQAPVAHLWLGRTGAPQPHAQSLPSDVVLKGCVARIYNSTRQGYGITVSIKRSQRPFTRQPSIMRCTVSVGRSRCGWHQRTINSIDHS
jgi:hypothetical protein